MTYQEFSPHQSLAPFIEQYYFLDLGKGGAITNIQALTAEPYSFLVFRLHGESLYTDRAKHNAAEKLPTSFIAGQMTYPTRLVHSAGMAQLGVKFSAGGLYQLSSVPASAFTNEVVAFDALFGTAAQDLENQIQTLPSLARQVQCIDTFFRKRLSQLKPQDCSAQHAVDCVKQHHGTVSIDDVAYQSCISSRQLRRKFEDYVGMSPKRFSALVRFTRAHAAIHHTAAHSTSRINFAAIACQTGYYDQAHFIREFKLFSGLTPAAFLHHVTSERGAV
jgi:AraC-like DNA-binding protein